VLPRAGKHLATTGGTSDAHICVWDWRGGQLLARQPLQGCTSAAAAAFTGDGASLVGAGRGAYKVWALSEPPSGSGSGGGGVATRARARGGSGSGGSSGGGGGLALAAKPVALKDHKGAHFIDVCPAPTPAGQLAGSCGVYALTAGGVLVLMRATARMPDKAVDLQVGCAVDCLTG
jgi:hypothetical protein